LFGHYQPQIGEESCTMTLREGQSTSSHVTRGYKEVQFASGKVRDTEYIKIVKRVQGGRGSWMEYTISILEPPGSNGSSAAARYGNAADASTRTGDAPPSQSIRFLSWFLSWSHVGNGGRLFVDTLVLHFHSGAGVLDYVFGGWRHFKNSRGWVGV